MSSEGQPKKEEEIVLGPWEKGKWYRVKNVNGKAVAVKGDVPIKKKGTRWKRNRLPPKLTPEQRAARRKHKGGRRKRP